MNVWINKLEDVLVVGCYHDICSISPCGQCVGSDEVIGFGVREFNALGAKEADVFLKPILLWAQVFRHGRAVLFVGGLEFDSTRWQACIPNHSRTVGSHIGQHLANSFNESVDRICWLSTGVLQASNGKKRAVEIVVAVNKKQAHQGSANFSLRLFRFQPVRLLCRFPQAMRWIF